MKEEQIQTLHPPTRQNKQAYCFGKIQPGKGGHLIYFTRR